MPSADSPIVRLFFACDEAALDLAQRYVIKNPWHTVRMPPGVKKKFGQRELLLYAQLTDGNGDYRLGVEMRRFDPLKKRAGLVLGRSDPVPVTFPTGHRLGVEELVFRMTDVPFPTPDLYEFLLLANGVLLENGQYFLRVLSGEGTE